MTIDELLGLIETEGERPPGSAAVAQDLLPVMTDRGGNVIALVLRADRCGEMVLLDHEVGNEGAGHVGSGGSRRLGLCDPLRDLVHCHGGRVRPRAELTPMDPEAPA